MPGERVEYERLFCWKCGDSGHVWAWARDSWVTCPWCKNRGANPKPTEAPHRECRRVNRIYRWGIGVWIGRRYFHLRRPDGPRVFSERYGGAWCREAFGWRLTIRTEAKSDAG